MIARLPRMMALNVTVALVSFLALILEASPRATASEGTTESAAKPGTVPVVTIQVQTPDGKPLPNVTVVGVGPSDHATVNGTSIEGGSERMLTDSEGRFRLTLNGTNFAMAVATEAGFNLSQSRDLTNNSTIIVQPWGRIEGVRMNGNRPLTNDLLCWQFNWWCVGRELWDRLIVSQQAITDAGGRFAFEHVPPTEIVLRELHPPRRKENHTDLSVALQYLEVAPGETKDVKAVTVGRTVVGRLVFGDDLDNTLDLTSCFAGLSLAGQTHFILPVIPKEYDQPAKRIKWWHDFWFSTDAGQRFIQDQLTARIFDVQPDGSFRTEIVAPGEYSVWGGIYRDDGKRVAMVEKMPIAIPESASDAEKNPFNMGQVTLQPEVKLKLGDSAPDFDVKTLEDQSLKLSDFRGRYVLLDFWATWCGPCVAEMPNLKATYDAFGKGDRFVMISLSLDSNREQPRKFAETHGIHWIQVHLDERLKEIVTASYGVYGIPSILLIGPDGKIVARDLRGTKIRETMAAKLDQ
jgi:peroxiredoxin